MKELKDIIYKTGILEIAGSTAVGIDSVAFDSRKVEPGCMFVAVKGTQSDGHDFISQAIAMGAVAVVCEKLPAALKISVTYVRVADSGRALGFIASNFYDEPSSRMKLIGVTGTNGKTTIATLLFELFRKLGFGVGLLSTVENRINDDVFPATHTTPDALELNRLLKEMTGAGCTYCFMEVSSHAVVQHRIAGLNFTGGIFTNITHDHLDFHKTFDEYLKAKKGFFDELPERAFALTNADDKNGYVMCQNTRAKTSSYGLKSMADFRCRILENHFEGMKLNLDGQEVWSPLVGTFNAYNLLAIYAAAVLSGADARDVLMVLSELIPVEGRFDLFTSVRGVIAIVDYAHTPDAVKNVLLTINEIRSHNEQLITVIGAGGDRDRTKRPVMAKVAAELSDKVILTSDNPRSEEAEDIIEEMKKGVEGLYYKKVSCITDRKQAIQTACNFARKGDIILVAGKGHEKYQEIKGVRYAFDDKKVIMETLAGDED